MQGERNSMRTLFIGNSHTYFNDMPKIFKDICAENGIDMQVTMLTKGGMGLDYHAENEQTRFNILFGDYDFVIIQHVAHPMGEFEDMEKAKKINKELSSLISLIPFSSSSFVFFLFSFSSFKNNF